MSSRKTERQLDLLFILLNASRPMSREVIRQKIEEYRNQDNQESFERMFERDKDELRSVGVPIETKLLDPLFEDEFGYELRLDNLSFKKAAFNSQELAELMRATLIWEDSTLSASARLGLVKSMTESGEIFDEQNLINISNLVSSHHYVVIAEALVNKKIVEFDYYKPTQSQASRKRLAPERIFTKQSHVYLSAIDLSDSLVKTFNLARIASDVEIFEAKQADFQKIKQKKDAGKELSNIARLKPRFSPESILHSIGGVQVDDWIEIEYFEDEGFALFIAPIANQISEIQPQSLKDLVINQLELALEKIQ